MELKIKKLSKFFSIILIFMLTIVLVSQGAYAKEYTIPDGYDLNQFDVSQLKTGDILAFMGNAKNDLVIPATVKELTLQRSRSAAINTFPGKIEMQATNATLTIDDVSLRNEKSGSQSQAIFFSATSGKNKLIFNGIFTVAGGKGSYAIESIADLELYLSNTNASVGDDYPLGTEANGILAKGNLEMNFGNQAHLSVQGASNWTTEDSYAIHCLGDMTLNIPYDAISDTTSGILVNGVFGGNVASGGIYCAGDITANVDGYMYAYVGAKKPTNAQGDYMGGNAIVCDGTFALNGCPQNFVAYNENHFKGEDRETISFSGGTGIKMTAVPTNS